MGETGHMPTNTALGQEFTPQATNKGASSSFNKRLSAWQRQGVNDEKHG
jgi:hypothetical protein